MLKFALANIKSKDPTVVEKQGSSINLFLMDPQTKDRLKLEKVVEATLHRTSNGYHPVKNQGYEYS